jgi:peptidoglycan LD-endopeptidase LytH
MSGRRRLKIFLAVLAVIVSGPYLIPEKAIIPVDGATPRDWHPQSFWYEPWGTSGVHKGVDIFAPRGQWVIAPTSGVVVYRGEIAKGGNVVLVLGPKWRFHYFAHLATINIERGSFVRRGERIGTVGDTGNAGGKPTHLHYTVASLLPRPWAYSTSAQGWKRMFFVDPTTVFVRE